MGIVYVVQESVGKNTSGALKYGEARVVFQPGVQVQHDSSWAVEHARDKLYQFGDDDFVLCLGDPTLIGICCAVASAYNDGRFKLLKWDRQSRMYVPVKIDIKRGPEDG